MFVAALAALMPFGAQAEVSGLPLNADRCAIGYALTGTPLDGCPHAQNINQITRSVGPNVETGYFIHFGFDSNVLSPAEQQHIDRLSELLRGSLQGLCIKLVGHTDTKGSVAYNQSLSESRANSVRLYMAGPGQVPATQIAAEGHGELSPLAGFRGEDARNRRVEILAKENTSGLCS